MMRKKKSPATPKSVFGDDSFGYVFCDRCKEAVDTLKDKPHNCCLPIIQEPGISDILVD